MNRTDDTTIARAREPHLPPRQDQTAAAPIATASAAQDPAADPADIPAGPGDAGQQDRPLTMPKSQQRDRGGWGRVGIIVGIGIVIALIVMVF